MVSLYEKKAFERHGLKVYISRTNDNTMGDASGPSHWPEFRRTVHSFASIATQSRYAYSNHHNSTTNTSKWGWEILVNARATASDLAMEHKVGNAWNAIFNKDNGNRATLYTRHYYTQAIYDKQGNNPYSFIDWYGMQRVSDMLFNEFIPTYEHAYISNPTEFNWYMNNGVWQSMAEAKVKQYVTALGKTYIAP